MRSPFFTLVLASCAALAGCGADVASDDDLAAEEHAVNAQGEGWLSNFHITNYTLAQEKNFSGAKVMARGPKGEKLGSFRQDFLCSGKGIAMQGTGLSESGKYVKFIMGTGGGWKPGFTALKNCDAARFEFVDTVFGARGESVPLEAFRSIAVDPKVIRLGSYVWIGEIKGELGGWFRADDTGGAIDRRDIDVYTATKNPNFTFTGVKVFVTKTPHESDDPAPR